ncbi:HNH endonuclease [Streptomyces sp. MUM 136J]|nr:HNH endonuclease [Streptomyces sp. MUM 136J]
MRELREKIGGDVAEDAEHFNRRLRNLRKCGWILPTNRDYSSIPVGYYRLDQKGLRIWLKSEPKPRNAISMKTRRLVLDRDGNRCKVCGVGDGESYPGEPATHAKLTIGHRIPQERLHGRSVSDDIDNLRTECSRCNEPVRDEMPDPERFDEVLAEIRRLKADDRKKILAWLRQGERSRSRVDMAYDRARKLSYEEVKELIARLESQLRD